MNQKRGGKRRGRAFYEELHALRAREGLSYTALSERSGVPISTLQRWGRRLAGEGDRSLRGSLFVEAVPRQRSGPDDRVELRLRSGRTICLAAQAPFPGLRELVTLLETC